jgi:hypothetical protein
MMMMMTAMILECCSCTWKADDSWDGTQFVYTQSSNSNYYWNIVKLLRKYGLAPIKVILTLMWLTSVLQSCKRRKQEIRKVVRGTDISLYRFNQCIANIGIE